MNVNYLRLSQIKLVHDTIVALLEELSQLDLALLVGQLALYLAISVIDDGNEHVQEDKEDEEYVGQEEDGTEHTIRSLKRLKVKVAENDAEQSVTRIIINRLEHENEKKIQSNALNRFFTSNRRKC